MTTAHSRTVSSVVTLNNCKIFYNDITDRLILFEQPHDKTNKMACAPSEDSDRPGHPPSLISSSLFAWKKLGSLATHWAHRWMPRLIRVFAGHTCHFVGFVMRWLIFSQVAIVVDSEALSVWVDNNGQPNSCTPVRTAGQEIMHQLLT